MADAFIEPLVIDSRGVDGSLYCDDPVLERLVGGRPEARAQQLREISPTAWLPWSTRQDYVVSSRRGDFTKAETEAFAAVRRAVLRQLAK
jgi:hypothetical protein